MEELDSSLGSLTYTWSAVGSAPASQKIQIPSKACLKDLVLRLSGSWDQSVGTCTIATAGCLELIKAVRLLVGGQVRREVSGPNLFELNRIFNAGVQAQTDPDTSVATSKAFSASLIHSMTFGGDLLDEEANNLTLLDMLNYGQVFLEIEMNAFSVYASGNTQANMTATIAVSMKELPGVRRVPVSHAELLLVQSQDMTSTLSSRKIPLNISKTIIRGLLLRCGTLAATPRILATTAISSVGVTGKYLNGPLTQPKAKLAPGDWAARVARGRNGITLRTGYLWLDFASDHNHKGMLAGKAYSDLNLDLDITGTSSTTLEVYQYSAILG